MIRRRFEFTPWLAWIVMATACDRAETPATAPSAAPAASTNRVAIPHAVRQNLGLTFAKVERRAVARTLRVPGRFELLPTASREYRVPAAGRIEFLVDQYQHVEAGTALYRLDAPLWRETQAELSAAVAEVQLAQVVIDSMGPLSQAHVQHHREIELAVSLWTERVRLLEELKAVGGARAEELTAASASLASARSDLAETLEKEAELAARRSESTVRRAAAASRLDLAIASASSLSGVAADELLADSDGAPRWQRIRVIESVAMCTGIVDALGATNGAWTEAGTRAVATMESTKVRFRAEALQSDIGRIVDGSKARIVAPAGGSLAAERPLPASLLLAPTADPERRTIELIVTPERTERWTRAGVAAFVEITLPGADDASLAIPLASVVRDGLDPVIFRRDPKNPDQLIRMEADLGTDDGRWVTIASGVMEGDEVVLDGVYPLLIATSGTIAKGGHFHPDGTFHEGDQ